MFAFLCIELSCVGIDLAMVRAKSKEAQQMSKTIHNYTINIELESAVRPNP